MGLALRPASSFVCLAPVTIGVTGTWGHALLFCVFQGLTQASLLSQHSLTHGAILAPFPAFSFLPTEPSWLQALLLAFTHRSMAFYTPLHFDFQILPILIFVLWKAPVCFCTNTSMPSVENFLLGLLKSVFLYSVFTWNTSYSEIFSLAMLTAHWLRVPLHHCIPLYHIPCLLSSKDLIILWNHFLICSSTQFSTDWKCYRRKDLTKFIPMFPQSRTKPGTKGIYTKILFVENFKNSICWISKPYSSLRQESSL